MNLEIANEFNDLFYCNSSKSKFNYSKYLRNPNEQSFFIYPTKVEEVLSEIKNVNYNKPTGPCSISLKFLKLFQKVLSE